MSDSKQIKSIKTSSLARGLSMSKLALKTSLRFARGKISSANDSSIQAEVLRSNAVALVTELGKLKGSAMKLGQSLAIIGEHFFSDEVVTILKSLNQDSRSLEWPIVEKVLVKSLGRKKLQELEIDKAAFAAASLGQVHRGCILMTGDLVCLKIQYPGVAKSIDSDLRTLYSILKFSKLIPGYTKRLDDLFSEVKTMLKREVNYQREVNNMHEFTQWLQGDSRYIIPQVFNDYCSPMVITSSYEAGESIDSMLVTELSLHRRRKIACNIAELFLREIFEFRKIQSDPHFGNYKVRINHDTEEDKIILLDFGAMRKFPKKFMDCYQNLVIGSLLRKPDMLIESAFQLAFINESDSEDCIDAFIKYCYMIVEPWLSPEDEYVETTFFNSEGLYDWAASDLPKRASKQGLHLALKFNLRPPPQEVIFLDRKLAGFFTVLKALNAPFNAKQLIFKSLKLCDEGFA